MGLLVGRSFSGSMPSFRRAVERRSAPRLDEGSVPGMDFGARGGRGGCTLRDLERVGGGWLGVGFGLCRSMNTSGLSRG